MLAQSKFGFLISKAGGTLGSQRLIHGYALEWYSSNIYSHGTIHIESNHRGLIGIINSPILSMLMWWRNRPLSNPSPRFYMMRGVINNGTGPSWDIIPCWIGIRFIHLIFTCTWCCKLKFIPKERPAHHGAPSPAKDY
jgi:hypothetical protein